MKAAFLQYNSTSATSHIFTKGMISNVLEDFRHIGASLGFIQVLKLHVDAGLCLHVWHRTRKRKLSVLLIKLLDSIGNDPEARSYFGLRNEHVNTKPI